MTVSLKAGDVISYPYLWRREADNGETEGRKTRPAVVVVPLELRRVGLTAEKRGWVIVSEHNRDIVGEVITSPLGLCLWAASAPGLRMSS